ncbi:MAG: response regulator [Erysipelotrichaceae bacterium]
MRIILIDDDPMALKSLYEITGNIVHNSEIVTFISPKDSLKYCEKNIVDVAFLGIEMQEINGIFLASKLKEINNKIHIIFVTAHEKYAVDAFQIHATGYLIKPAKFSDVLRELSYIYNKDYSVIKNIKIKTFGGFDIFINGQILSFKRSKSKELLAYLVDRRGSSITVREACDILFEDGKYDVARKNYFQTIVNELYSTLKQNNAQQILIKKHNCLAIDPATFECDSYNFLDGDLVAINNYRNDYMICYSWAQFSMGKFEGED